MTDSDCSLAISCPAEPADKEFLIGPSSNSLLHEHAHVCDHTGMLILPPDSAERKIAIHVLLRLTRMDVCCGPPRR